MALSFDDGHGQAVGIGPGFRAAKPDGTPGGGGNGGNGGNGGKGDEGDPTQLTATYVSGEDDALTGTDNFNVELNFYGDWTLEEMNAMAAAADYLSLLITAGLLEDTYESAVIDDVSIDLVKTSIDGQLGVAAQGGPTSVRSSDGTAPDGLTVTGVIEFDEADLSRYLNNGTLDDLALHEMLHVLGIGTLWEVPGVRDWVDQTSEPNLATRNPFDVIVESTYVGPDGTQTVALDAGGGHLDEAIYGDALMTPSVNIYNNYLSDITLQSLADLGYEVDSDVGAQLASTIDLNSDYGTDVFALA